MALSRVQLLVLENAGKGGRFAPSHDWRLGAFWQGWAIGWMFRSFRRSWSGMSSVNDGPVVAYMQDEYQTTYRTL